MERTYASWASRQTPSRLTIPIPLMLLVVASACSGASTGAPDSTTTNPDDERVTIIEFGDYQCGPCARMGRTLHTLCSRRRDQVRLVYRHCPSRRHQVGRMAAIVASAATELGSFWALHWELVTEGPIDDEERLWEIASGVGLEEAEVRDTIATGRPERAVARDLALADQNAVRGMPTTFINGRRLEGTVSLEGLMAIVDEAAGPQ